MDMSMSEYSGENSILRRDLAFAYRLLKPANATGECLFLLHGSGVDETTMLPLAMQIAPRAVMERVHRVEAHRTPTAIRTFSACLCPPV